MGGMSIHTGKYISDDAHIIQCIQEIIITLKMTRIISRDFGIDDRDIVDRSITPAKSLKFKSEITRAITQDEKRVKVEKIELSLTPDSTLIINVKVKRLDNGRELFVRQAI